MKAKQKLALTAIALTILVANSVFGGQTSDNREKAEASYTPGLGDLMGATQGRHAKLWFAGSSKNWDLAAYELDEIREGLKEAVRFNPVFKNIPVAAMLNQFTAPPLSDLNKAIETKNSAGFKKAYDRLTNACNACHQAAGYGFITIKRPIAPPSTNQLFAPQR